MNSQAQPTAPSQPSTNEDRTPGGMNTPPTITTQAFQEQTIPAVTKQRLVAMVMEIQKLASESIKTHSLTHDLLDQARAKRTKYNWLQVTPQYDHRKTPNLVLNQPYPIASQPNISLKGSQTETNWPQLDDRLFSIVSTILERRFMFKRTYRPDKPAQAREQTQPQKFDSLPSYLGQIERVLKIYQDSVEQVFNELIREKALGQDQHNKSLGKLKDQTEDQTHLLQAKEREITRLTEEINQLNKKDRSVAEMVPRAVDSRESQTDMAYEPSSASSFSEQKVIKNEVGITTDIIKTVDQSVEPTPSFSDKRVVTNEVGILTDPIKTVDQPVVIASPPMLPAVSKQTRQLRVFKLAAISVCTRYQLPSFTNEETQTSIPSTQASVPKQSQPQPTPAFPRELAARCFEILQQLQDQQPISQQLQLPEIIERVALAAGQFRLVHARLLSQLEAVQISEKRYKLESVIAAQNQELDSSSLRELILKVLRHEFNAVRALKQLCPSQDPNIPTLELNQDIFRSDSNKDISKLQTYIRQAAKNIDAQVEHIKATLKEFKGKQEKHDYEPLARQIYQRTTSPLKYDSVEKIEEVEDDSEKMQEKLDEMEAQLFMLKSQLRQNKSVMDAFVQLIDSASDKRIPARELENLRSKYPVLFEWYRRLTLVLQENSHLKVCLKKITQSDELWGHLDPQRQIARFGPTEELDEVPVVVEIRKFTEPQPTLKPMEEEEQSRCSLF